MESQRRGKGGSFAISNQVKIATGHHRCSVTILKFETLLLKGIGGYTVDQNIVGFLPCTGQVAAWVEQGKSLSGVTVCMYVCVSKCYCMWL